MPTVNKVKEKIASGQKALGAFVNLSTPAAVEILALAGLDFVVIDTEHGPFDIDKATELILAAEARGLTPFVRVKEANRSSVLKTLDAGAMGLLIPYIKTADEVRNLVAWGKYRPLGDRGYGFTRAGSYGHGPQAAGGMAEYFANANQQTLLIPQCETAECLEHIEEIVAIPGLDGIFIGPFDLSISLEIAGQFDHPRMHAAFQRVLQACHAAEKLCFILAATPEDAKWKLDLGFDGVLSADVSFLQRGVSEYVAGIGKLMGDV